MINANLVGKPGVLDGWEMPMQDVDGVINLNLINKEYAPMGEYTMDKHIVDLIMAHQFLMKKGIKLFGERAEKASLKE